MMTFGSWRIVVVAMFCLACERRAPPIGQVVLHIDTDAPIGADATSLDQPVPLFDRIRFDVLASACRPCTNEFEVTDALFHDGNVSFGIVPPVGRDDIRVRVRLFRSSFTRGEPEPSSTIDVTTTLPPVPSSEGTIVDAILDLRTDDIGIPVDRATRPGTIAKGESRVHQWEGGARSADCGALAANEACVPGGAFWMGNRYEELVFGAPPDWHRLVVVSPFIVQTTEVTVAQFRASGRAPARQWSGDTSGASFEDWCAFSPTPMPRGKGSSEDLPLNCVSRNEARSYCQSRGGDLPTEAQLEYLLGGLRNARFVWDSYRTPGCQDAIWARNGAGLLQANEPKFCWNGKTNFLGIGGPEPPGPRGLDAIALNDKTIVDIAGNLQELARDAFQERSGSCWSTSGVLRDPVCSDGTDATVRGGSFLSALDFLDASARTNVKANDGSLDIGFRCVRPAN